MRTRPIHLLSIALVLAGLAAAAWWYSNSHEAVPMPTTQTPSQPLSGELYTKDSCEKVGGSWNECASPCPADAEACIQMCVARCEFFGSDDVAEERVQLYFLNQKLNPEQACEKVFPVERTMARFPDDYPTIEALLAGPTAAEKAQGYETAIPGGVEFINYESEDGTTRFVFSAALDRGVGGSCRVQAIRAQIAATVKAQGMADGMIEIAAQGKSPDETLQP